MSTRIEDSINNLIVQTRGEINSRIEEICFNVKIDQTETICHCYCLKMDANNNLRLQDLIEFIDLKIVEYAIPKKEIDEAKKYLEETQSPQKFQALRKKAEKLFTDLEKTGEGGEILLYILVQEFLKIPQLISKMSLKTSGQLHYQGADGIHVSFDHVNQNLNLYWGEAKMYADLNSAMAKCFESIKGFLLDVQSAESVQERDLQLITANIASNVNDPQLEDALVRYFDKDDDLSNHIVYKGLCFIGFDSGKYPTGGIQKTTQEIKVLMQNELNSWQANLQNKLIANDPLHLKEMHVFLMPFPSVADFRAAYLKTIK